MDLSGTLGAKQLVVVNTQAIYWLPTRSIVLLMLWTSVDKKSPSFKMFSMIMGSSPETLKY